MFRIVLSIIIVEGPYQGFPCGCVFHTYRRRCLQEKKKEHKPMIRNVESRITFISSGKNHCTDKTTDGEKFRLLQRKETSPVIHDFFSCLCRHT